VDRPTVHKECTHPQKNIRCGLANHLSDFAIRFDAIFCLHLFMHLPVPEIESVLRACFDQLQPGGLLIFDVPSADRRRLTGFRPDDWHAGTALSCREVAAMTEADWLLRATRGVLFLPIHRLPAVARQAFRPCDDLAGMTPFKRWSSYLFFCLERRP
jgi:2-polyprenyl-3-methyl-5-hydroxy-6-metoxy-1,4-benzoquinol methylase